MKKKIYFIAMLLLLGASGAQAQVAIDAVNFPDPTFRNYVLSNLDTDKDSTLSTQEAANTLDIDVSGKIISSMKGIEHFANLTKLICSHNNLDSLDITHNTKLVILDFSYNHITTMSLPFEITNLTTDHNTLEVTPDADNKFDMSTLPNFKQANITNCNGGTLDGSILTFVDDIVTYEYFCQTIYVQFNLVKHAEAIAVNAVNFPDTAFRAFVLQKIDDNADSLLTADEIANTDFIDVQTENITTLEGIKYMKSLVTLYCSTNSIDSLDLSANTALQTLNCGMNPLTWLNISKCTQLIELSFYGCSMDSIDLTPFPNLVNIYCDNNNIKKLDFKNNSNINYISVTSNPIDSIDVSGLQELQTLYCDGTNIKNLDVTHNVKLNGLYCNDDSISSLDLTKNVNLTALYASDCKLTSLDLSADTLLSNLSVYSNPLTQLNLQNLKSLNDLECNDCNLTDLDVSAAVDLLYLNCQNNKLSKIDVSKNINLESLNCYGNQLTALDLSNNSKITQFDASSNTKEVEVNTAGQFDLTTLAPFGFDVAKASNWTDGTVDGNMLTFASTTANATYDYDCGQSRTETFTLVPKVSTAAPLISGSEVKAFATGNVVNILGTDAKAQVFDAAGRTVYAGDDRQITIGTNGLYLVKVAGKTFKVVIR
jgi:Leucine-rich repeat (LRR) protein